MEYLRHSECYSFQTFAIVFSTPWNLLVGITGALEQKKATFSAETAENSVFWENATVENLLVVSQKWVWDQAVGAMSA